MTCHGCNTPTYKDFCSDCWYDNTITIWQTDAKKRYKLSDNDLDKSKIFKSQCVVRDNIATKYAVKDVEKLVEQISNKSETDKRYIALKSIRDKINEEQMKIIKEQEDISYIKQYMVSLSDKYDIQNLMIQIINGEIDSLITRLLKDNTDLINISMQLLPSVYKKANARNIVNQMLLDKYKDAEFCTYIMSNSEIVKCYNVFVDNNQNNQNNQAFDKHYQELIEQTDKALNIMNRTKYLDNFIKTTFDEKVIQSLSTKYFYNDYYKDCIRCHQTELQHYISKFTKYVNEENDLYKMNILINAQTDELRKKIKNCVYYKRFIAKVITLDDANNEIHKIIDKYNLQLARKNKINALIDKYIGKEYSDIACNSNTYKQYMTGRLDKLKMDKIIERIIEEVDYITERNSRIKVLEDELLKEKIMFIKNVTANEICIKFIDGDDEFDDIMNEIKLYQKTREKRHNEIISVIGKKYYNEIGIQIPYTDSYYKYIDTGLKLNNAIDTMKINISKYEIKNKMNADKQKRCNEFISIIGERYRNELGNKIPYTDSYYKYIDGGLDLTCALNSMRNNIEKYNTIHNLENIIQNFIKSDNKELILNGYEGSQRSYFHNRAQQLNLYHTKINATDMKIAK